MIEVSLTGFNLNRGREALNSLIEVTPSVQRDTLVIVGVSVLWVYLNRSCVVLNSQAELAQLIIGEATVKECLEMVGINL